MRSAPITFFIIMVAGLLLQSIPVYGLVFASFTIGWWSALLINLILVCIIINVVAGDYPRIALVLPVGFYASFLVTATLTHREFAEVDTEFRQFNAGKSLTFDPHRHTLAFEGDQNPAQALARFFDIPVVYSVPSGGRMDRPIMYRAGKDPECAMIRSDPRYFGAHIHAYGLSSPVAGEGLLQNVCMISGPVAMFVPTVTVKITESVRGSSLLPIKAHSLTVESTAGSVVRLKTGYAAPLLWLPMFDLGCLWWQRLECRAQFRRGAMRGLGAEGGYGGANPVVVASALGLKQVPIKDRKSAPAVELAKDALKNRIKTSLGNLDDLLANRRAGIIIHDVTALDQHPDLLVPRAGLMVQSIERLIATGPSRDPESARVLQQFIAALPSESFRLAGPAVVRALMRQEDRTSSMVGWQFLLRSADLGSEALPLLRWAASDRSRGADPSAILGLCRLGRLAESTAPMMVEALNISPTNSFRNRRYAAIVTLRRFGRADLLANDPHQSVESKLGRAARFASVSQASGPDVCTIE